jgi:hypothetical protein
LLLLFLLVLAIVVILIVFVFVVVMTSTVVVMIVVAMIFFLNDSVLHIYAKKLFITKLCSLESPDYYLNHPRSGTKGFRSPAWLMNGPDGYILLILVKFMFMFILFSKHCNQFCVFMLKIIVYSLSEDMWAVGICCLVRLDYAIHSIYILDRYRHTFNFFPLLT